MTHKTMTQAKAHAAKSSQNRGLAYYVFNNGQEIWTASERVVRELYQGRAPVAIYVDGHCVAG